MPLSLSNTPGIRGRGYTVFVKYAPLSLSNPPGMPFSGLRNVEIFLYYYYYSYCK